MPAVVQVANPVAERLRTWRRIGGRSLRFALLGPAIGGGAFFVVLIVLGLMDASQHPHEPIGPWLAQFLMFGGPVALAFGYVFGVLPALLTGAFAGWLAWRGRRGWHPWAVTAFGGLGSAAIGAWVPLAAGSPWLMAMCGALSALACEAWCRRMDDRAAAATLPS